MKITWNKETITHTDYAYTVTYGPYHSTEQTFTYCNIPYVWMITRGLKSRSGWYYGITIPEWRDYILPIQYYPDVMEAHAKPIGYTKKLADARKHVALCQQWVEDGLEPKAFIPAIMTMFEPFLGWTKFYEDYPYLREWLDHLKEMNQIAQDTKQWHKVYSPIQGDDVLEWIKIYKSDIPSNMGEITFARENWLSVFADPRLCEE